MSRYKPTVSILIPAHNEEKVIGKLLQKMTEITYPKDKLEVIVIDDASCDNTGQIADEYCKKISLHKSVTSKQTSRRKRQSFCSKRWL